MRIHLDTSFLIDWARLDLRTARMRDDIAGGVHDVSIDAIVEAEFLSVKRNRDERELIVRLIASAGAVIPLTSEPARLAAGWLAPMDERQRRAHFPDALIAAIAHSAGATLVTGDHILAAMFPVAVLAY